MLTPQCESSSQCPGHKGCHIHAKAAQENFPHWRCVPNTAGCQATPSQEHSASHGLLQRSLVRELLGMEKLQTELGALLVNSSDTHPNALPRRTQIQSGKATVQVLGGKQYKEPS